MKKKKKIQAIKKTIKAITTMHNNFLMQIIWIQLCINWFIY